MVAKVWVIVLHTTSDDNCYDDVADDWDVAVVVVDWKKDWSTVMPQHGEMVASKWWRHWSDGLTEVWKPCCYEYSCWWIDS